MTKTERDKLTRASALLERCTGGRRLSDAHALLDEVLDHDREREAKKLVRAEQSRRYSLWIDHARCPDCESPLTDPLTGDRSPKGTCPACGDEGGS